MATKNWNAFELYNLYQCENFSLQHLLEADVAQPFLSRIVSCKHCKLPEESALEKCCDCKFRKFVCNINAMIDSKHENSKIVVLYQLHFADIWYYKAHNSIKFSN